MSKADAVEHFHKMLNMYNRVNKAGLRDIIRKAIKTYEHDHPESKLTTEQRDGITKRVAGQVVSYLASNMKKGDD